MIETPIEPVNPKTKRGLPVGVIAAVAAVIAAVAAFVSQVETIKSTWCNYIGLGCVFELSSATITASAGGTNDGKSDVCKTKELPLCISPTKSWREFYPKSVNFVTVGTVEGTYNNGDPTKAVPSSAGWFPKSATAREICVTVYARTGACETWFSVTGMLKGKEYVPWWSWSSWWPWW